MPPSFYDSNATVSPISPQEKIKRCVHDKENPYAQISRELLRNNNLSFRARGLLCYMLSFPNNWEAHPQFIAKENGIGRDQIYAILKELIDAGYCRYVQEKVDNKFSSSFYEFSEAPIFKKFLPHTPFPYTEVSDTEKADLKNNVTPIKETVAKDVVGEVSPSPSFSKKQITKDDLYHYSLSARTDWKPEEIESSWLAYCGMDIPITDPYAYIAGIINKKRALQAHKEKTCHKTTTSSNKMPTQDDCKKKESTTINSRHTGGDSVAQILQRLQSGYTPKS